MDAAQPENGTATKKWRDDPNGFFRIGIVHGKGDIVVEHYSNSGQLLRTITGKNPEEIYRKIAEMGLATFHDHSSYLGYELARAAMALSLNMGYEQDAELKFPVEVLRKKEVINYVEKIQFKTNAIPEKDMRLIENKLGGRFFMYMKNNGK